MPRTRILAAALLSSSLFACGGQDPASNEDSAPRSDMRQGVLGSYDVTGTMTVTSGTDTNSVPVRDTLRISPNAITSRVNLLLESLGCGPSAWMRDENFFSINTTECPLDVDERCTAELVYRQGSGERSSGTSTLQVSLNAELVVSCGGSTAEADVVIELTAESSGAQRVPTVQRLEASEHLQEALARLAHAASR